MPNAVQTEDLRQLLDQAQEHPDASETQELPAALKQVDCMTEAALVVLLDIHP